MSVVTSFKLYVLAFLELLWKENKIGIIFQLWNQFTDFAFDLQFHLLLKVLRLTDPSKLLKKLKLHEETDAGAKAPSTSNDLL